MKRRTLLQAGLASLLLPRMEAAVACGSADYDYPGFVIDLAANGAIINTDISKVLDNNFGKGRWYFEKNIDGAAKTPGSAENPRVIPYHIWLYSLPRHWKQCTQVDFFIEVDFGRGVKVPKFISKETRYYQDCLDFSDSQNGRCLLVSRVVCPVARFFPTTTAPIRCSGAYRGFDGKPSTVYAVFSGIDVRGNRQAMAYKFSPTKTWGCDVPPSVLESGQDSDRTHRASRVRTYVSSHRLDLLGEEDATERAIAGHRHALRASARDEKAYSLLATFSREEERDGRRDGRGVDHPAMAGYVRDRNNSATWRPAYSYYRAEYFSELEIFHQRELLARLNWSAWAVQRAGTSVYLPQVPEGAKLDVHLKHSSGFTRRYEIIVAYNKSGRYSGKHVFEQAS